MNYRGVVKLIKHGHEVHSFSYFSREERRIIIERWRHLYKDEFWRFHLHILPVVIDEQEKRQQGRPKKEAPRPFVRPPAVYDNNRSLYQR